MKTTEDYVGRKLAKESSELGADTLRLVCPSERVHHVTNLG